MKSLSPKLSLLSFALLAASSAQATILVEETFATAGNIVGQTGGTGFTGAWASTGTTGTTFSTTVSAGGLGFSDYDTGDGTLTIVNNAAGSNVQYGVTRQTTSSVGLTGATSVWVSFVIRNASDAGNQGNNFNYEGRVGIGATAGAGGKASILGYTAGGLNNPDASGLFYNRVGGVGESATANFARNTNYLLLANYTNTGVATLWVLNAANWDSFKTGSISTAGLDANNVAKIVRSGGTAGDPFANSDYVSFLMRSGNGGQNVTQYSAFRMATTLESAVAIPEPATFAGLFGLGALGWAAGRRRRA
jgi:hypothetical protein